MNDYERSIYDALTKRGFEVLHRGWPDFLVLNAEWTRGFALELKFGEDKLSPEQARMHHALARFGILVQTLSNVTPKQVKNTRGRVLLLPEDISNCKSIASSAKMKLTALQKELERLQQMIADSETLIQPPTSSLSEIEIAGRMADAKINDPKRLALMSLPSLE